MMVLDDELGILKTELHGTTLCLVPATRFIN